MGALAVFSILAGAYYYLAQNFSGAAAAAGSQGQAPLPDLTAFSSKPAPENHVPRLCSRRTAPVWASRPPLERSSADETVSCEQSPSIWWWQDRLSSLSPTSAPCPSSAPATPTSSPSPTPSTPPLSSPPSRVHPNPPTRVLKRLPRRVPVEAALFPRAGGWGPW